ncbi:MULTISPECIES: MATE family efflux transporter [Romboutsia]|jgi:putative MATE family efflux protein|uniref:MATE family efflux transporter n=1 Tax=Romboutsia TaxID=1501226 RepID=UPI002170E366|nr:MULTISPECIES: MATE family efflux transporter [Romboutsia]MCI9061139.1 MATE family efflux transporter [Romboutsia sp.]
MKKVDLTQGKVLSVIAALAIPIMGSSLLQFTYNIVDMFWVGGLGSNAVASVGSASFFVGLGYSINTLVVIGAGIKVSHALGRNEEQESKAYINSGIFVNFILGLLYAIILIFAGKYFIGFLNLGNEVVENGANLYLMISAPMLFFSFFNQMYIRILGSYGHNSGALRISAIGIVLNIILDPIFIYTFKFGVLGAAIATLISNIAMFIIFRISSKGLFNFDFKIGIEKDKVIEVIKLGFPMAFQRILFTLVNIVLARIISIFGSDAIAGQKIGLQIESVTFMIIGGLNGAIASFTGQNFGAKKYDRIIKGYHTSLTIGIVYAVITSIIFILIPEYLVNIFIKDASTIKIASMYLQIIAYSQIFSAIEMVSNGMFTGLGMPNIPAAISIIFTVLRIPMALIFIKYFDVNGIWLSISVSSVLKGIASYMMYRLKVRKDERYA